MSRLKTDAIRNVNASVDGINLDTSGRIGIGTSSPTQKLEVLGTTNLFGNGGASVQWGDTSYVGHLSFNSSGAIVRAASSKALVFHTNHVNERMRIHSSGDVSIGRDSVLGSAKLSIQCDAGEPGISVQLNASAGTSDLIKAYSSAGPNVASICVNPDASPDLLFKLHDGSNTVERVRIRHTGEVGINCTPARPLHIVGNDGSSGATSGNSDTTVILENAGTNGSMIEFLNANNGAGHLMFTDPDGTNRGRISYHHNGDFFRVDTSGSEKLRITSDGKLGIGITNPAKALVIAKDSASAIIELRRTNTNTTGSFGAISWTAMDGHSVANMYALGDGDNEGAHLVFRTTSAAASNDPYNAATVERLRITSAGKIGIGDSSPQSKLAVSDAGSTADPVIMAHISGSNGGNLGFGLYSDVNSKYTFKVTNNGRVQVNDGIDFSLTSHASGMTSELLSDYEEGTWTPANQYLTITNNNTATYTKVGRLVTIQFDCTYASSPADTAQVGGRIEGLPFSAQANGFHFTPSFTNTSGNAQDNESLNFLSYVEGNSDKIKFYSIGNNCEAIRAQTAGYRVRGTVTYMV